MGIVHPGLPQGIARQGVELAADRALGEHGQGQRDVALEHAGKAVLVFRARLARPDPDGAGDVGGAIQVLPARIDQVDRIGADRQVRFLVHPVMRAGRVGTGGGDRVERQVAQQIGFLAEGVQPCRCRQFRLPALWRFDAEPVEELGNRCPVAVLGGALSGLLDGVLHRLGQHGRVRDFHHLRARRRQNAEHGLDRAFRIDRDLLARQRLQLRHEVGARQDRHRIAQMGAQLRRYLLLVNEQLRRAIRMGQHEGQGDRRPLYVGAAKVEQPGDAVQRGNHGGIQALGSQPFGHFAALRLARLAGIGIVVNQRGSRRGRGLVGPDRVDRIALYRNELCLLVRQRLRRGIGPGLAVQPRVEPDPRAGGGVFGQPCGHAGRGYGLVFIKPPVHLLAHLQGIAPVNKDRRLVSQDGCRSGRTAKAGQPGQPLGIGADIFAHMLVGNRDNETVEGAGLQFLAQRVEPRFVCVHQHGVSRVLLAGTMQPP